MEDVLPLIVDVEGMVAEGQVAAESGIHEVRGEQVEKDRPAVAALFGGPGLDKRPPEEDRGAEETDV